MAKSPTGSSTGRDGRPRAQAAYEGNDEFSLMSLDPSRRRKDAVDLTPNTGGARREVYIDEMKPKKRGMINFLRKIFPK